jgi:Holliday junction resolvase-like predicted endonuclease
VVHARPQLSRDPLGGGKNLNSFQVAIAAEAFAAALLAQAGCDISVQYGANQPEYDLIASRGNRFRKISVKGSQDGGWVLAAGYKKGRDYHGAIAEWASRHKDPSVIYCFVQFKGVPFGALPRVYLARIDEVGQYLKASRAGQGYTSLRERYEWASGVAKGCTDLIPAAWVFSESRVNEFISG